MKPDINSYDLLGVTRSKAKMFEYSVNSEDHIKIPQKRHPSRLFDISIGMLGDLAFQINETPFEENELDDVNDSTVQFSAQFFDSYLKARLNEEMEPYLLLVGAASYYLCDLPGSSLVLANQLKEQEIDLESRGLENLLLWILKGEFLNYSVRGDTIYKDKLLEIYKSYNNYYKTGEGIEVLLEAVYSLRKATYEYGSNRELLFADVIYAVSKKRLKNSVWFILPRYSNLPLDIWENVFKKDSFIQELWPAQHMIGQKGIFKGESGVIQMPTSAGKTKATEIIIRSAFLSNRTSLAVIVAPFRALCHEISTDLKFKFRNEEININEVTDVLQIDFDITNTLEQKNIMVVTPEKLLYILRHSTDLAKQVGLIIYDEGHQFDNGTRGITYELLLTSLKLLIPESAQSLLISAVINNADSLGEWLHGETNAIISSSNLIPTYRTIALVRWYSNYNDLEFVSPDDITKQEFFVPNVLAQYPLELRGRERKARIFPDKDDANSVALFLGVKLVEQGTVAIFSERKDSISLMCNLVVDAYKRGFPFPKPLEVSDYKEIQRLHYLYEKNLGDDITTQAAEIGILTHHGNIPKGIRISVEYAMREGLGKYIICTSTLAQGVNLPIRYLILSHLNSSSRFNSLKVRDFHNLIGRVGRSGMHTEGSIIFADPNILIGKRQSRNNKKWNQLKYLLEPVNSESISSSLKYIFEPINANYGNRRIIIDILELIKENYENPQKLDEDIRAFVSDKEDFSFDSLKRELILRFNIVSSVESFLMAEWQDSFDLDDLEIDKLAKETLAHFLATEEVVQDESGVAQEDNIAQSIIGLFRIVARNISNKISDNNKKRKYGTTFYGADKILEIEAWVLNHILEIKSCNDEEKLLEIIWPLLESNIQNDTFNKFNKPEVLKVLVENWVQNSPFSDMLSDINKYDIKIGSRKVTMNHVIEICDNAFAYEATLVIASIIKVIELNESNIGEEIIEKLELLQKRLKYGLKSKEEILIYELGFSDRVIVNELYLLLDESYENKNSLIAVIKSKKEMISSELEKYPLYFKNVLNNVVEE